VLLGGKGYHYQYSFDKWRAIQRNMLEGGGGEQLQGEVEEVNPRNSFPNIFKDTQFLILIMNTNYGKA
jgi:hypothetical protein